MSPTPHILFDVQPFFSVIYQLIQVETALASCKASAEWDSLDNLKRDLTELLELTEEQLNELDNGVDGAASTDPFEDEMQLFLSEIRNADQADNSDDIVHCNSNNRIEAMKVNVERFH